MQSRQDEDATPRDGSIKNESRKIRSKSYCKELQTKDLKKVTKARWGRSLLATLPLMLCLCLPCCCVADSVGYPQLEDLSSPSLLVASKPKPFGLPVVMHARDLTAMASAAAADASHTAPGHGNNVSLAGWAPLGASHLQLMHAVLPLHVGLPMDFWCSVGLTTGHMSLWMVECERQLVGLPTTGSMNSDLSHASHGF